jgi:hypothetical protein
MMFVEALKKHKKKNEGVNRMEWDLEKAKKEK